MSDPIPEPSDTNSYDANNNNNNNNKEGVEVAAIAKNLGRGVGGASTTGETFLSEPEELLEMQEDIINNNNKDVYDDHDSGCRTCFSAPHGKNAKMCCFFSTLAWTLSFVVLHNCRFLESNYLYCPPEGESTTPCTLVRTEIGLTGYAATPNWLGLPANFLTNEEATDYKPMFFGTCFRYQFATAALSGFWYETSEIFGTPWKSAQGFAITACVLGFVCKIVAIVSLCMAYSPKLWKTLGVCFWFCGVCKFMTLLFFASDVCELGCSMGEASIIAIVAGIFWEITAYYAFKSAPTYDTSIPKATCCCCPQPVISRSNHNQKRLPPNFEPSDYTPVPTRSRMSEEVKEIMVVEKQQPDGSKVVEKTITYPNGHISVERTIYKSAA